METIVAAIGPRLRGSEVMAVYEPDDDDEENDDPTIQNGVAIINVLGTLVRRSSGMAAASGMTSYESLTKQFTSAIDDPDVRAVLLRCDSPGGEVAGMLELSDLIFSSRGIKPVVAAVDDCSCSAAYAIASAADKIIVTRTGMAGSIGCFVMHLDQSGADKTAGLKFTYIFSGEQKVQGNEHEPLNSSAREELQSECDRIQDLFARTVARNRGVSVQSILATQAGVRYGPANIPLFGDQVGTCDEALAALAALSAPTYSLPAAPASLPAARQPRLLTAPHASVSPVSDPGAWLAIHSNLTMNTTLNGAVDRFRAEESSLRARYGQAVEARIVQFPRARATAAATGGKVSLLIAPSDSLSINLGNGTYEMYQRGCWAGGLGDDPRMLRGHDDLYVIGRQGNGTARFWEGIDGLRGEADGPAGTVWFSDLLQSMRRGDIDQASAGFYILDSDWQTIGGKRVRLITRALLRDGNVVSRAAYTATTATAGPAAMAELETMRARLEELRNPPSAMDPETELILAHNRLLRLR